ncbi:LysR family transcriptional regulator [Streptomyces sp. NPDC020801]|uniref:LysR family transcriptional regulator n=1 Tax=unclassified Streptomyces TaxID=2593676 RepID=UPI0037BB6FE1
MRLEYHHLNVVVQVADAGSIRAAAAVLQISQPALSTQLRRIEQLVGAPLFDRHRDGVQPTDLGHYVISHARRLVAGLDELRTEVEGLTAPDPATVRIAAPATVLPLIVAELRRRVRGASVHSIAERYHVSLIDGVVSGSLSFAVTHEPSGPDQALPDTLESAVLLREPVFVGLHPDHPLAASAQVDLAQLAAENWILPRPDGSECHRFFSAACEAVGFVPRISHLTTDSSHAVALVSSGEGVAGFYPAEHSGIVLRPLTGNPLSRELVLVWCTGHQLAPQLPGLCESVRAAYCRRLHDDPRTAQWWHESGESFVTPPLRCPGDVGRSLSTPPGAC